MVKLTMDKQWASKKTLCFILSILHLYIRCLRELDQRSCQQSTQTRNLCNHGSSSINSKRILKNISSASSSPVKANKTLGSIRTLKSQWNVVNLFRSWVKSQKYTSLESLVVRLQTDGVNLKFGGRFFIHELN